MSQAKVDRYKEQKAHRKEIMKKEKRQKMLWKIGGGVAGLVLAGWICYSAIDRFYVPPVPSYEGNTAAHDTYISDLSAKEAE